MAVPHEVQLCLIHVNHGTATHTGGQQVCQQALGF